MAIHEDFNSASMAGLSRHWRERIVEDYCYPGELPDLACLARQFLPPALRKRTDDTDAIFDAFGVMTASLDAQLGDDHPVTQAAVTALCCCPQYTIVAWREARELPRKTVMLLLDDCRRGLAL